MNKNLKPGDFVTLVPLGLPMTLQYNISGNLEKVFVGNTSNRRDITASCMTKLLDSGKVPGRISLQKGTSWVIGVLYTNATIKKFGVLPSAIESDLESAFLDNPNAFNFFAYNIECTSLRFSGHVHIRQYLRISKFNVLPGWFVPAAITDSMVTQWMSDPTFTFNPIVTDMVIFRGEAIEVSSMGISQCIVKSKKQYVDDNGYVKIEVLLSDNDSKMYLHYTEAAKYGVTAGTVLYLDQHHQIFYSKFGDLSEYKSHLICPFCGKYYDVPTDGTVQCQNKHCGSKLIPEIIHFMTVLNLPMPSTSIRDIVYGDRLNSISDFLLVEKVSGIEITASLSSIIRSLVPVSVLPNARPIHDFVVACASNPETVKYYANNPGLITSDLNLHGPEVDKLILWFEDGFNVSELITIMESENVTIVESEKRFDGAPIFRNKLIYITGSFIHKDIAEILTSYAAKVTSVFTNSVDCVLIGGTNENIDGKSINAAKNIGIPISNEVAFFAAYGIDADLNNLVY